MRPQIFLLLIFIISACVQNVNQEEELPVILPDAGNGGISLPENFAAVVVADNLGRGRHLVVNDNGDIYAHLRAENEDGYGIVALRDTTHDGRADMVEGISTFTGTGIEIHNGFLYYSTQTRVYRSPLIAGELKPGNQIDTLAHVFAGRGHVEKPFTFDNAGNMYVNVGSMSNACEQPLRTGNSPGEDPCTELETRGGIWRFSDSEMDQKQENAHRYATGIRNAVALTWNNQTNSLYAVSHGRDDLHRYWPEKFTEAQNVELPSEEFFQIDDGDDFGWPYCYYDHMLQQKFLNPEYGGDGSIVARCEDAKEPIVGFPGHWGPNDILFYDGDLFPERYKHGAFIAFHGSWNRLEHFQDGYKVVFVPMENGMPSGPYEDFATNFLGNTPIENPGEAVYRPCGLAQGPDGSLYVLDSQKGRLWRIMYFENGVPVSDETLVETPTSEQLDETVSDLYPEGKLVYDTYCRACHQSNGLGAPGMIPPLKETDYVTGDKTRLINIVLNGLYDPVEINGETYQNAMAAMPHLSDQEISDVLTFIRNSFGNEAEPVTVEEVSAVRGG